METVIKHEVSDPFLQRMEEPLYLFGQQRPAWMWVAIVIAIVAVGLFYVGWMYIRERRTIGWFWPIPLGLFRITVYAILGLLFLLPSRQHTDVTKTERSARVVLLFDVSLSMKEARDGFPAKGGSFKDVPSRQDKVFDFLTSDRVKFIERLETKGRPVVAHRFAQQADPDYRWLQRDSEGKAVNFWPSGEAEWARRLVAQRGPQPTPGYPLTPDHWKSWLFPTMPGEMPMPAGWNEQDGPGKELLRQLAANKKATIKFFEGTALGEALLDVIRREQGGQVQGIVVFTDGRRTEGSDKSIKDAAQAAKAADIPIFVVGVGREVPKVSIDIVDLRVPPLIRPEDKFRVMVTVNGHDMPVSDPFELFLDITRKGESKDKKEFTKDIELVALDEKGNLVEEKTLALKPKPKKDDGVTILDGEHKGKPGVVVSDGVGADGMIMVRVADKEFPIEARKVQVAITLRASKHSKDNWGKSPQEQKPPTFKAGNPPNAQIEFELDAATLAHMVRGTPKLPEGFEKVGLFPDDGTELTFRARVPKDERELMDAKEHFSEVEKMGVQKRPLRVLLFASSSGSREFQFVQNLLVREETKGRAEVCAHVQQIPGGEKRSGIVLSVDKERLLDDFPTKRKAVPGEKDRYQALSSYDVIVAFDADWTQLSKEQLKMINEWVEKDGGGLIFVAGDMNTLELARPVPRGAKADTHPLLYIRDMLPIVLEDSRKSDVDEDERLSKKWRLLFPQATSEMEFMRLDETDSKEQWKKGWDRFFNEIHDVDDDGKDKVVEVLVPPAPPERGFHTFYPSRAVKQNALVIASFDAPWASLPNSSDRQPFFARGPWGNGMCFWIAAPDTYVLRTFREAYHERFWTKLIREVGSKSINVANKRIVPVMSRTGVVNKPTTFEVRFEDLNGKALRRDIPQPPVLIATLPPGTVAKKGDLVVVKDGEHAGDTGRVVEVKVERDVKGGEVRLLRLANLKGLETGQTATVDARKVEVTIPPSPFKPRLGTKPSVDLDRKNDGWFKVEFVPPTTGDIKLRVHYNDAPDNFYNHKFIARDEIPPELENLKPDVPAMLELASSAGTVLSRIPDENLRERVRNALKAAGAAKGGEGPVRKSESADERLKLYFEIDGNSTGASPEYIPDCMITPKPIIQRRKGDLESLWDKCVTFYWNKDSDRKVGFVPVPLEVSLVDGKDFSVGWRIPAALLAVVLLLSMEWLIRKLLRLA